MAKNRTTHSPAESAQKKHWERTGQLASMLGLCNYLLNYHKKDMPKAVTDRLSIARDNLSEAFFLEKGNKEFLDPNITPKWRKK
jgi:hypothetical protein